MKYISIPLLHILFLLTSGLINIFLFLFLHITLDVVISTTNILLFFILNANLLFFYMNNVIGKLTKHRDKQFIESKLHFQTTVVLTENLHHELNTPLTVITSKIKKLENRLNQLITTEDCTNDSINDFKTIDASLTMIRDVLDRLKSFKNLKIYESRRTIYEIIKVSCELIKTTNSDDFTYEIDSKLKQYKIDSKHMRNGELTGILVNHITNSLEAHANIVKFKFNDTYNLNNINNLSFYIADNGNGIPVDKQNIIFDENTSSKNDDRGNGLFVNKIMLEHSNGSLGLIASSTRGTIFDIRFPYINASLEEIERSDYDLLTELEKKISNNDTILQQVIDTLPDMVWFKQIDGAYVIANKAIREGLLFDDEPIGKNDIEISKAAKEKFGHNNHTFGEKCANSDLVTLERNKPSRFLESGKVKGEMMYLEVNKSVVRDSEGNILGVCGSGRDLTEYIEALKSIEGTCLSKCNNEALEVFTKYEFGENND